MQSCVFALQALLLQGNTISTGISASLSVSIRVSFPSIFGIILFALQFIFSEYNFEQ